MIPIDDGNENIADLHPGFRTRLSRFFTHPEIADRFTVESAARTYAEQKRLYDGYRAGWQGFNLAANPDNVIGATTEGWQAKGSWHMVQGDGNAYAVDLTRIVAMTEDQARDTLNRIAPLYGLLRTVPSEWWHLQPRNFTGWFPDPHVSPTEDDDMLKLYHQTGTDNYWLVDSGVGKADPLEQWETWLDKASRNEGVIYIPDPNADTIVTKFYDLV
jgi:hypothetical protein